MNFLKRTCLFLCLIALASISATAAIPHPLNIPLMLKRAATATAKKFPEANTVLVDDFVHSVYQADGTYVTWDDMAYKVLTPKGREQMKTLSTYYSSSYGKASILLLEIYKADGTVVRPPLDKLRKEMSDPGQMRSNIYDPNHKIITVSVPGLELGDTIRYCVRQEVFKSRCPNTYSDIFTLESSDPIINFDILIDGPKALPLKKIAVRDPVPGTVTSWQKQTPEGRLLYGWKVQNVPVMIPEPKMPRAYTVCQRLMVSTINSWEDVSRWYWNLCQPRMTPTSDMKAKVAELTKGLTTQMDKIRSIFKFVSQDIRYVGITMEDDAPGYEPHDVATTFRNRHGVCRDKAALLVALLRLADIKAFPVLIMAGEKIDQEVCQPFFNHAITAALDKDGRYILMDSTDENTRELFPSYLADKSFLVARKEGETLQTSPFSPAKDNLMLIETTGTIDDKGTLEASTTLKFNGANDNAYRGFFATSSPEDIRDFMHRAVKAVAPGASLTDLEVTPQNMLNTNVPLSITLTFSAKRQFTDNDQVAMFRPPYLSRTLGLQSLILKSTQLDTRKYPYKTNLAASARETITLTVAASWGTPKHLPNVTNVDDGLMTWKQTSAFKGHKLKVVTETSVNKVQYTPQEYLTLKRHIKTIHDNSRKKFIFFKPQAGTPLATLGKDAEIIAQTIAYNLTDATTWTENQTTELKIFSYKGKKENSELLLSYNPAFQKVSLDYARVTTTVRGADGKPTTRTQEINRKDIKVMDQRWVASAPRYPAAKILVVPLPGVEVGSVIQYKFTRTTSGIPFFNLRETFREVGIPVRHKSIIVNTPAQLKLSTAVFQSGLLANSFNSHQSNIAESFVTENNRTIWTWTATDQPAVPEEPQQAPVMTFAPTIFCATYPWSEYLSKVTGQLKTKAVPGKKLKQAIANLKQQFKLAGKAQLQAVNETLNLTVRDAGPSYLSLPFNTLSTAETTFTDGYGHDADRAIVAFALLKGLGYHPEFVFATASEYPHKLFHQLYSTPSPSLFPELLVKVSHQGETFWFNDQNQYADIRTTSAEDCFALNQHAELFTITPPKPFRTTSEMTIRVTLDDQGGAKLHCTSPVNGTSYTDQNKHFSQLTPELRKRLHLSLVRAFSPRAVPSSPLTANFKNYPGTLDFSCDIPHFATLDGNYMYFTLPADSFRRMAFRIDEERETPLARFAGQDFTTHFIITLPQGFKHQAMIPKNYQWHASDGESQFRITVSQPKNGKLILTYHTTLKPTIVTPELFPQYRKLDDVISHESINTILLTK